MGLFSKSPEEKAAVAGMKAADMALNANTDRERAAGIDYETPEYQRLNTAANEAAGRVSVWRGGTRRRR